MYVVQVWIYVYEFRAYEDEDLHGGQKKVLDALELELPAVMCCA